MPIKVFIPNQYQKLGDPNHTFPIGNAFTSADLFLLSDGNPETGIVLPLNEPTVFGFTDWDIDIYDIIYLSDFTFEIDVSSNSGKFTGDMFINIFGTSYDSSVSSIDFAQEVTSNNTYFFNPIPGGAFPIIVPPSNVDHFNSVTIAVQSNIAGLKVSAIRKNLTSRIGGKVILSNGYINGRQGKISI